MTVKEKAISFFKMFGSELALEFYHDDIALVVEKLFQKYTVQSIAQLIESREIIDIPDSLIEQMAEYSKLIEGYDAANLAALIFGMLYETRPDLAKAMDILGDKAATWFVGCITAIRDRLVNPERYDEEIDKAQTVLVTCNNCGRSLRVFREDVKEMKSCPFCSSGVNEETPLDEEEE